MKKLMLIIAAILIFSGLNTSAAKLVFEEDFQSYNEGYDLREEKGKKIYSNVLGDVNVVKRADDNLCLELDRTTTNTKFDVTMGYNLTRNNEMRGFMVYEWDFMQKVYSNDQRMIVLANVLTDSVSTTGTKNAVKLKTNGGKIQYDAGSAGWIDLVEYSENKWYRFKVEVDYMQSMYNVYVDGIKLTEAPLACVQNSRGAYNTALDFTANAQGTYYVDNIRLFTFEGKVLYADEDFESYSEGFDLTTDKKGVWSQANSYNGELSVKNISGNNAAYIKKGTAGAVLEKSVYNPDSNGTVMTVEWDFMKTEKSSNQRVFLNATVSGTTKRITCIRTTDEGNIEFCAWSEEGKEIWYKIVDQYITNRWYNFKVVVNTNSMTQTSGNGTFDIYVDSVAYQPAKPLQSYQNIRSVQPKSFSLQCKNMSDGEFYVDNIKMYQYSMDTKPNLTNNELYYLYNDNKETVECSSDIVNMDNTDYELTYLVAMYDKNGVLKGVKTDSDRVLKNDINTYAVSFDSEKLGVDSDTVLKMFLWESGTLVPFDSSVTLTNIDNERPQYAYLVLGQSNMAYRGQYGDNPTYDTPEGLYLLNNTSSNREWKWKLPVNTTYSMEREQNAVGEYTGIGVPYTFGVAMQEHHSATVGLIDCAVGGVAIDYYRKGIGDGYKRTVERALYAKSMGVELKGIIWLQGESERIAGRTDVAQNYASILNGVIEDIRTEIGEPDLPLVAGEIGYFVADYSDGKSVNVEIVNEQIRSIPNVITNSSVILATDLVDRGDGMHFSPDSQEEYGRRFASAMINLVEGE